MAANEPSQTSVVSLAYEDLVNGADLTQQIERAFGYDGNGILTVSGVPGLTEARDRLLPLAAEFASLPVEKKSQYEQARSFYSVGWSHGREKLQGRPDLSKGSFYANPLFNAPFDDPEVIAKYPAFAEPNIWPSKEVPEMESAFMDAGKLMHAVGCLVAAQCDAYVKSNCVSYEEGRLFKIIQTSRCCKGRLLHYFPTEGGSEEAKVATSTDEDAFSNWCGWHNDHGSLTGLMPAIYYAWNSERGVREQVACPDAEAGLYIRGRKGQLVRASIPEDHLGFQIGETAQIHSGGLLQATPHAVRGARVASVSRETFAIFMEPEWGYPMTVPSEVEPAAAQLNSAAAFLPRGVPALHSRWGTADCPFSTCDFGGFTMSTLNAYH